MADIRDLFNDPARSARELFDGFVADPRVAKLDMGWNPATANERLGNIDAEGARALGDAAEMARNSHRDPFATISALSSDAAVTRRVHRLTDNQLFGPDGRDLVQTNGEFKNLFNTGILSALKAGGDHQVEWLNEVETALRKVPNLNTSGFDQIRSGLQTDVSGLTAMSLIQSDQNSLHMALSGTNSSALSATVIDRVFNGGPDVMLNLSTGRLNAKTGQIQYDLGNALIERVLRTGGARQDRYRYNDGALPAPLTLMVFNQPRSIQEAPGAHRTNIIRNQAGFTFLTGAPVTETFGRFGADGRFRLPQGDLVSLTMTEADVEAGHVTRRTYERLQQEMAFAIDSLGMNAADRLKLAQSMGLTYDRVGNGGRTLTPTVATEFVQQAHAGFDSMLERISGLTHRTDGSGVSQALGAKLMLTTQMIKTSSSEWRNLSRVLEGFVAAGGEVSILASEFRFKDVTAPTRNRDLDLRDRAGLATLLEAPVTDVVGDDGVQRGSLVKLRERAKLDVLFDVSLRAHAGAGADITDPLVRNRIWSSLSDPVVRESLGWSSATQAKLKEIDSLSADQLDGFLNRALKTGRLHIADSGDRSLAGSTMLLTEASGQVTGLFSQSVVKSMAQKIWDTLAGRYSDAIPFGQEHSLLLSSTDDARLAQQADVMGRRLGLINADGSFGVGYSRSSVLYGDKDDAVADQTSTMLNRLGGSLRNVRLKTFENRLEGGGTASEPLSRRSAIGFNVVLQHEDGTDLLRLRVATDKGRIYLTDFGKFMGRAVLFNPVSAREQKQGRFSWSSRWRKDARTYGPGYRQIGNGDDGGSEMFAATLAAVDTFYDYARDTLLLNEISPGLERFYGRRLTEAEQKHELAEYARSGHGRKRIGDNVRAYYRELLDQNSEASRIGRLLYPESVTSQAYFYEDNLENPFDFLSRPAQEMTAYGGYGARRTSLTDPLTGQPIRQGGELMFYQRTQDFYNRSKATFNPLTGNLSHNQPKGYMSDLFRKMDILDLTTDENGNEQAMIWLPVSKIFQQSQRLKSSQSATIYDMEGGAIRRENKRFTNAGGTAVDAYRFQALLEIGSTMLTDSALVNEAAMADTRLSVEWTQELTISKAFANRLTIKEGQVFTNADKVIRIAETSMSEGRMVHSNVGFAIDNPLKGNLELADSLHIDKVGKLIDWDEENYRVEIKGRLMRRADTGDKISDLKATVVMGSQGYFEKLHAGLKTGWNAKQWALAESLGFSATDASSIHMIASTSTIKTASALLDTGAALVEKGMLKTLIAGRSDAQLVSDIRSLDIKAMGQNFNLADPAFKELLVTLQQHARSGDATAIRRELLAVDAASRPGERSFFNINNPKFRSAAFLAFHLHSREFLMAQLPDLKMNAPRSGIDASLIGMMAGLKERGFFGINMSEDMTAEEMATQEQLIRALASNKVYLPVLAHTGFVTSQKPTSSVVSTNFMRYYGSFYDKKIFDSFANNAESTAIRQSMVRTFTTLMYGSSRQTGRTGTLQRLETYVLPGEVPHFALLAQSGFAKEFAAAGHIVQKAKRQIAGGLQSLGDKATPDQIAGLMDSATETMTQHLDPLLRQYQNRIPEVEARLAAEGTLHTDDRGRVLAGADYLEALKRGRLGTLHFVVPMIGSIGRSYGYHTKVSDFGAVSIDTQDLNRLFGESDTKVSHVINAIHELSLIYAQRQDLLQWVTEKDRQGNPLERILNESDHGALQRMNQLMFTLQDALLEQVGSDNSKYFVGGFKVPGRATAPTQHEGIELGTVLLGTKKHQEIMDRIEAAVRDRSESRARQTWGSKYKKHVQQEYYDSLGLGDAYKELSRGVLGAKAKPLDDARQTLLDKAIEGRTGLDAKAAAESLRNLVSRYDVPWVSDPITDLDNALNERLAEAITGRNARYEAARNLLGGQRSRLLQERLHTLRFGMGSAGHPALPSGGGWWLSLDVKAGRLDAVTATLQELGITQVQNDGTTLRVQAGNHATAQEISRILQSQHGSDLDTASSKWHENGRKFAAGITGKFHLGGESPLGQVSYRGHREFVVFDLETEGRNPTFHEPIEIGAVKIRDGQIVDRFTVFIDPGRPLSQDITKLTTITDETLKSQGVSVKTGLERFFDFAGGSALVAHNSEFDASFIREIATRHGIATPGNDIIDTLEMAKRQLTKGGTHNGRVVHNHKLGFLTGLFGIDLGDRAHRAIYDAEATASLFMHLVKLEKAAGGQTVLPGFTQVLGSVAGEIHTPATDVRGFSTTSFVNGLPESLATAVGGHTSSPGTHYGVAESLLLGAKFGSAVEGIGGNTGTLNRILDNTLLDGLESKMDLSREMQSHLGKLVGHLQMRLFDKTPAEADYILAPFKQDLGPELVALLKDKALAGQLAGAGGGFFRELGANIESRLTALVESHGNSLTFGVMRGDALDVHLRKYYQDKTLGVVSQIMAGEGTPGAKLHQAFEAIGRNLVLESAEFKQVGSLRAGAPLGGTSGAVLSQLGIDYDAMKSYWLSQGKTDIPIAPTEYGIVENPLAMMINQGDWDGDLKSFVALEGMAADMADRLAFRSQKGRGKASASLLARSAEAEKSFQEWQAMRKAHGRGRVMVEFAANWIGQRHVISDFDRIVAQEDEMLARAGLDTGFDPVRMTDDVRLGLLNLQKQRLDLITGITPVVQQLAGLYKETSSNLLIHGDLLTSGLRRAATADLDLQANLIAGVGTDYWKALETSGNMSFYKKEYDKLLEAMGTPISESPEMMRFISEYTAVSAGEVIGKAFNDTYAVHNFLEVMQRSGANIAQSQIDVIMSLYERQANQSPRDMVKPKIGQSNPIEALRAAMANPEYHDAHGKASGALYALKTNAGVRSLMLMHSFLNGIDTDYLGESVVDVGPEMFYGSSDTSRTNMADSYTLKGMAQTAVHAQAEALLTYTLDTVQEMMAGKIQMLDRHLQNDGIIKAVLNNDLIKFDDIFSEDAETRDQARGALDTILKGGLTESALQTELSAIDADTSLSLAEKDRLKDRRTRLDRMSQTFHTEMTLRYFDSLTAAFSDNVTGEDMEAMFESHRAGTLSADAINATIQKRDMQHLSRVREMTMASRQYVKDMTVFGSDMSGADYRIRLATFSQMSARSGQFHSAQDFAEMLHDVAFGGSESLSERLAAADTIDRHGLTRSVLEGIYLHTGVMQERTGADGVTRVTANGESRTARRDAWHASPMMPDGEGSLLGASPESLMMRVRSGYADGLERSRTEEADAARTRAAVINNDNLSSAERSEQLKVLNQREAAFKRAANEALRHFGINQIETASRTQGARFSHLFERSVIAAANVEHAAPGGWMGAMGAWGSAISASMTTGTVGADSVAMGLIGGVASSSTFAMMNMPRAVGRHGGVEAAAFATSMLASMAFDRVTSPVTRSITTGRQAAMSLARGAASMAIGAVVGTLFHMAAAGNQAHTRFEGIGDVLDSIWDAMRASPPVSEEEADALGEDTDYALFDDAGEPIEFMADEEVVDMILDDMPVAA